LIYNVLVVEDNDLLFRMYSAVLIELHCRVLRAATVAQSIHALGLERFDLAIVDLRLPDGSGAEVIRAIRANAALESVPVVVITTQANAPDQAEALAAGASTVLFKPVNIQELGTAVRGCLTGRQGAVTP